MQTGSQPPRPEPHSHPERHTHGKRHTHGTCEDPAHLLAEAEAACRSAGLQFTALRRRVLAELAVAGRPLGAYDLVERLGREKRIAPISVYRALDFLIEAGLIHRIATRNTFLPCHHAHAPHDDTVFLVCTRCGNVDEVVAPEASRGLDQAASGCGFKPSGRAVELEGECAACLAAP